MTMKITIEIDTPTAPDRVTINGVKYIRDNTPKEREGFIHGPLPEGWVVTHTFDHGWYTRESGVTPEGDPFQSQTIKPRSEWPFLPVAINSDGEISESLLDLDRPNQT